jgi:hypothetical protein
VARQSGYLINRVAAAFVNSVKVYLSECVCVCGINMRVCSVCMYVCVIECQF